MSRTPERGGGKGGILGVLSSPPRNLWPEAILHHGARVLLLVALAALITGLFPPTDRMEVSRYSVGMVADEDILAEVPFAVPKSGEELARERDEARAAVPPTFNYRPAAADSMAARLDRFFQELDSLQAAGDDDALAGFLEGHSIDLTPAQLEVLRDEGAFELIRETALQATRRILPEGVADGSDLQRVSTQTITIQQPGEQERSVPRDEVLSPREFYDRAIDLLPSTAPPDVQEILRLVLIQFLDYSLDLNVSITEADREGAARAVATTQRDVLQGEAIVRANEAITASTLEELEAYQEQLRNRGMVEEEGLDLRPLLGSGLLNLLLLSVFGLLLYFFRTEIYTDFRWTAVIAGLVAAYFGTGAVLAGNELPTELLPVAFVALAVSVLWDGRMALVLAILLAVISGILPPWQTRSAEVIVVTLVGGSAAALSVRAVRRRAQTWIFSALIAGAYGLAVLGLFLIGRIPAGEILGSLGAAGTNAVLSSILAMGFIPVFEYLTGITTDQTLLEWADPNRSLLKRLSMEAPGTYAHTINVANLAESAANAIGANGLLCRVGLYYHDIGKMLKPHYFVENQPEGRNPHDRLKPDTSATIVKEHVTEGYKLALDENVPDVIADFIPEHHGTQRIGFFWEKAKEEYGEENLDPEDFQYPGPRPRSKETAIAMLADSVESATRALQDPTPERVRDLIENIVEGKISDGQLDDTPLTLQEIRQIKEQFIKVLSGIYHHRIDYPQTRHLTDKKNGGGAPEGGEAAPSEPGPGTSVADAAPGRAGAAVQSEIEGLDGAPAEPSGPPGRDGLPTPRSGAAEAAAGAGEDEPGTDARDPGT